MSLRDFFRKARLVDVASEDTLTPGQELLRKARELETNLRKRSDIEGGARSGAGAILTTRGDLVDRFLEIPNPSRKGSVATVMTMTPTLSFDGSRFLLVGIETEAAREVGFHWDIRKQVHWTGSSYIAKKFIQYSDYSAKKRFDEETARENKDLQEWPIRHKELLHRFLEIAERKVSILDDYGDETWDALPKEIERLLLKTATIDKDNIDPIEKFVFSGLNDSEIVRKVFSDDQKFEHFLKLSNSGVNRDVVSRLAKKYCFLRSDVEAKFRHHHASQKTKAVAALPDFREMTGVEFETFLARILKEDGYEVAGTPVTGDQGADLIIKKSGRTIAVQVKGYKGAVGNSAVQEIVGALRFYGADEGWVITNSIFTTSARELANANAIKLIDGSDLRSLISKKPLTDSSDWQSSATFIDL